MTEGVPPVCCGQNTKFDGRTQLGNKMHKTSPSLHLAQSSHCSLRSQPRRLQLSRWPLPRPSFCFRRFLHPAYFPHRGQPGYGTRFASLLRRLNRRAAVLSLASLVSPFPTPHFIRHRRCSASEPRFIRHNRRFGYGASMRELFQKPPS